VNGPGCVRVMRVRVPCSLLDVPWWRAGVAGSFRVGLAAKRTFTAATRSTSLQLPRAALCLKCRKRSL
jgi:hypothetical protein